MRIWNDKRVLITGVCGTIGANLKEQILNDSDNQVKELVCIDNNENELFSAAQRDHRSNVRYCLSDIRSYDDIKTLMEGVDIVIHAAALKHVFFGEQNPDQYLLTNIVGTQNIIKAAKANNVERVLYTSSDKAVNPTNIMGASKRIAEIYIQSLNDKSKTSFITTRFGNVLGSNGSVIPLFKSQIKDGGPVTVTDKSITRYFMMISEAVELVIQAGAMGEGGDVFVLNMGKPVEINLLAKKMIQLSGLEVKDESNPDGDIEIKYTGLRPGEKLFEELLIGENTIDTSNPLIMRAKEVMLPWGDLKPILENLKVEVESGNNEKIRKILIQLVPTFKPQSKIVDILNNKL